MFERKFNRGKEQRRAGSRWRLAFLLLLGGVILVGGLLFAARHMAVQQVLHGTGGGVPSSTRVTSLTPVHLIPGFQGLGAVDLKLFEDLIGKLKRGE